MSTLRSYYSEAIAPDNTLPARIKTQLKKEDIFQMDLIILTGVNLSHGPCGRLLNDPA